MAFEHAVVVGAGLSKYAGLPLTGEFTEALLDVARFRKGPSKTLVASLRRFVSDVFHCPDKAPADAWPLLEDLFTFIDLSANTGHHLGKAYSAAKLRTMRRAFIARTIRMLQQKYEEGRKNDRPERRQLVGFLTRVDLRRTAFISMNWDTVIEATAYELKTICGVDYRCDARQIEVRSDGVTLAKTVRSPALTITKLHGSINWLYCDNCQVLFWCRPEEVARTASLLVSERDWEVLKDLADTEREFAQIPRICAQCGGDSLSTRVATFSFRKALDFPMFRKSWDAAERILSQADTWTFIGYSLPHADFEFKHLLKRIQLARPKRPRIGLVTGGGRAASKATEENYGRLFGTALGDVFDDGLEEEAMNHLAKIGVLD